jgi:SAM-dependent methyltransferase
MAAQRALRICQPTYSALPELVKPGISVALVRLAQHNAAVQENYFDEPVAERYDDDGAMFDPDLVARTVAFLAEQADGRPALEFGIGTGRIAVPLAQRGVQVSGIDLSEAMIRRLRAKPGADGVRTVVGDFAHERVPGRFGLVYVVFNTIMNPCTQDEQVDCFANAAAHLDDGGRFVIEVMVPDLQRLPPGETARPFALRPDRLGFDEYDVATQRMWSHHYTFAGERTDRWSMPFRYVWPAELDLMARLAGMSLVERWSDWDRRPFTGESRSHVSVWQRPLS